MSIDNEISSLRVLSIAHQAVVWYSTLFLTIKVAKKYSIFALKIYLKIAWQLNSLTE